MGQLGVGPLIVMFYGTRSVMTMHVFRFNAFKKLLEACMKKIYCALSLVGVKGQSSSPVQ